MQYACFTCDLIWEAIKRGDKEPAIKEKDFEKKNFFEKKSVEGH